MYPFVSKAGGFVHYVGFSEGQSLESVSVTATVLAAEQITLKLNGLKQQASILYVSEGWLIKAGLCFKPQVWYSSVPCVSPPP